MAVGGAAIGVGWRSPAAAAAVAAYTPPRPRAATAAAVRPLVRATPRSAAAAATESLDRAY